MPKDVKLYQVYLTLHPRLGIPFPCGRLRMTSATELPFLCHALAEYEKSRTRELATRQYLSPQPNQKLVYVPS